MSPLRLTLVWAALAAGAGWHVQRTVDAWAETPAFRAAADHAAWSPRLREVVGEDPEPAGFPLGRFGESTADLRFRVEGSEGAARVALEMRRVDGVWRVVSARWTAGEDGGPLEAEDDADIRRGSDHAVQAWALYQRGRLTEALEAFGRAVEADPGNARTHHWRGWTRHDLGDLDAAAADFGRAVALDPEYGHAHYGLGLVLGKLGDHAGSLRHLDRAVALEPESGVAAYARAVTRSRLGDDAGARADLQRACALEYADACGAAERHDGGGT